MGLRINFNETAATAYRNLAANQVGLAKGVERLSSGYKINRGADDPAGLSRSEGLRAQLAGLTQALANTQDAVNMVKTAEGALTEVHNTLRSMRTLAVHAANAGANNAAMLAADQAQIASAIQSINNIAERTSFGGTKLLDGTASLGIGSIAGGGDGVAADISTVRASSTGSVFLNATGDKALTITLTQDAAQAKLTGNAGGFANTSAQLSGAANWAADTTSSLTVNGVNIGTFSGANTVGDVINAINNNATLNQTMTASLTGGKIVLQSKNFGSAQGITISETISQDSGGGNAAVATLLGGAAVDTTSGAASTMASNFGKDLQATVSGNGVGGATVDFKSGSGFTLKNSAGDEIAFSTAMVGTVGGSAVYTGNVTGNGTVFQIGAEVNETAAVSFSSAKASSLGVSASSTFANLSAINVSTNAQESLKVIDQAIADVSAMRASYGAFQKNVLESTINNLSVTKENVAASESAIRDADMAEEMASFTKYNILQQAGVAILSQANQMPQQLLQLLRG